MANDTQFPDTETAKIAITMMLREVGDPSFDKWRLSRIAAALVVGTLHGFFLWGMGTAVSWGMQSVGLAALVGAGVGFWHGIRQRVVIPLAIVCWVMGAMVAVAVFLRLDGTMISPFSGVIAWLFGATVARTVTRTLTYDDQVETVRSACFAGLVGAGVGWLLGATIAGTLVQLLEEPWCWTVIGASAGAIIGVLETNDLGYWYMARQALLKAIGGGVLLTCGYLGDGPFGWVAGASVIWMLTVMFFLPAERHSDSVSCVAVAPDGDLAVSCSADRSARFWLLHEGRQIGYLQRKGIRAVTTVAFSHDGQFAVAGRDDGNLSLLDGKTGHEQWSADAHDGAVRCVAISHTDSRIASGGDDGVIRLWEFESGNELRQFTGGNSPVTCVAFAPHGPYILSAHQSGVVRLWNLDNGVQISEFTEFTGAVNAVAFAVDGKKFFAADDQAIHALKVHGRTKRLGKRQTKRDTMRGHVGPVLSLAVMPGGMDLISGGSDGTVRLWNTVTGLQLGEMLGHAAPVNSIAVSDDGSAIVTGSSDCTVRVAFFFDDDEDDEYDEEEFDSEDDEPIQ